MTILFENEYFVVVEKSANWLSVPSRLGASDPRPVVGLQLQKQIKGRLFPIHRLDYEVSGILMFAKTPEAHRAASAWFEKREVHKIYHALTEGLPPPSSQDFQVVEWHSRLLRGKKRAYESPVGKPSLTRARLLENEQYALLWELEPVTGRAHQLRFDLSRHGYPILGDQLYGSQKTFVEEGIALRAIRLIFPSDSRDKWGLPEGFEIKSFTRNRL